MGRGYGPSITRARVGLAQVLLNGSCLGRLVRHGSFGHLYLRTIIMVLISVATTSFAILLLFSLPSCLHLHATHSR
jgi:hypothetical protein